MSEETNLAVGKILAAIEADDEKIFELVRDLMDTMPESKAAQDIANICREELLP